MEKEFKEIYNILMATGLSGDLSEKCIDYMQGSITENELLPNLPTLEINHPNNFAIKDVFNVIKEKESDEFVGRFIRLFMENGFLNIISYICEWKCEKKIDFMEQYKLNHYYLLLYFSAHSSEYKITFEGEILKYLDWILINKPDVIEEVYNNGDEKIKMFLSTYVLRRSPEKYNSKLCLIETEYQSKMHEILKGFMLPDAFIDSIMMHLNLEKPLEYMDVQNLLQGIDTSKINTLNVCFY